MSFIPRPDYYGLSIIYPGLTVYTSEANATASEATALRPSGFAQAKAVFAKTSEPSVEYRAENGVHAFAPVLGRVTMLDGKAHILTRVSIRHISSRPVSVICEGRELPIALAQDIYAFRLNAGFGIDIPTALAVIPIGDALILAGELDRYAEHTLTFEADIIISTGARGDICAYDLDTPRLTVSATIQRLGGEGAPEISVGKRWKVTGPLTPTNPANDYPAWNCELVRYLTPAEVE